MSQQSRQLTPVEAFRADLTARRADFIEALPPQVSVEKFQRVVVTAIAQNPSLLEGDKRTLWLSCIKAAQDGLLPDGREAAFVTFGKEVAYMPMLGGILKKIRNSGELSSIAAHVVYAADFFDYHVDADGEHFKHVPNLDTSDRGKIRGAYAVARTKDGGLYFEFLSTADIEKVRGVSRAKDSGPWKSWFDEMAKKAAIRRLAKRLPMSTDVEKTLEFDNETYEPLTPEPAPAPAPSTAAEPQADKPTGGRRRPSGLQRAAESQAPTPNETVVDDTSNVGDQPPI